MSIFAYAIFTICKFNICFLPTFSHSVLLITQISLVFLLRQNRKGENFAKVSGETHFLQFSISLINVKAICNSFASFN